jgi:hypothetical protein
MVGEVLDAGFRLFRASLLKCLPFSAASVIASQAPTLYDSIRGGTLTPFVGKDVGWWIAFGLSAAIGVWMIGIVFMRQYQIARLERPKALHDLASTAPRVPAAILATLGGFLPLLLVLSATIELALPALLLLALLFPVFWLGVRLSLAPYLFWCKRQGVLAAFAASFRASSGQFWRLTAMLVVMVMMVCVFYFVVAILIAVLAPAAGAGDIAVLLALNAVIAVVAGAIGMPFASALLVVAAEDAAYRREQKPGAS